MWHKRKASRDDVGSLSEDLASINQRLDELTRQLDRAANYAPRKRQEEASERVSDALSRLDRRLDQIVTSKHSTVDGRSGRPTANPPSHDPPLPPGAGNSPGWAAEIVARQRALEIRSPIHSQPASSPLSSPAPGFRPAPNAAASSPPAASPAPVTAPPPGPDLSGLEQLLRQITQQIETLQRPQQDGAAALRDELADIRRTLTGAFPRQAIEAMESEIRALSERVDRSRQAGVNFDVLTGLERGLAEVRDALQNLKPSENLVNFAQAIDSLSRKIDQISSEPQNSAAFRQIEQAIGSLRSMVANVASEGALAQLSAEVHGLAARLEHIVGAANSDALARIESQIATLANVGGTVPPELPTSIRALCERLDRTQLSKGDKLAIEALEDRIAKLTEKLDASDAKLGSLAAIERGLSELLVHLEEMRNGSHRGPRSGEAAANIDAPAPPQLPPVGAAMESAPLPPHPAAAAVAAGTAAAAAPASASQPVPTPLASRPESAPAARSPDVRPIDPNLPPDTPIEPGSGIPRLQPGSPAARIAASEAVLSRVRSPAGEVGRSAVVAAARNAARAAMAELQPIAKAKTGWIGWFRRTKAKAQLAPIAPSPRSAASFKPDLADTPRKSIAQHLKTLLIAASVAVIVLVTLQTVLDIFQPEQSQSAQTPPATTAPQQPEPKREAKPGAMLAPVGTPPAVPDVAPATSPPAPATTPADVTGSIGRPVQLPQPAAPSTDRSAPQGVPGSANSALPESFGPTLRSAAAAGNPAAEYEIGARYAEGRGVMQNLPEAVRWFERAAKAGFVPAQFRLAGFYEKGEGTSKNLAMARDLYLAAASKGHAKAMHNLAVLYAEGIDGKPDYKLAAEWFRKAALHGVTDSQFNLAVLYARGVGVSPNLTESYRWFALAANRGDPEAARKRDEIAKRLDQQTLATAKRAVQSFVTEAEPEDAISLKTPPGGWDHGAVALPAAPAPSRTRTTTHP